jgi:Large ribosomal RNA subunit accumulation protein YceD
MTIEFSRPIVPSKIGSAGLTILVRATPEECAAVAVRMGVPAIQSLVCSFRLTPEDDGVSIHAKGRLRAEVTRICVASAEEFETPVEEEFELRFVPAGAEREDPDPDLPDEIPYEAAMIDLGEATTEQLGLALDPYPRIDGAILPTMDDDEDASPFAMLTRRTGPDQTKQ